LAFMFGFYVYMLFFGSLARHYYSKVTGWKHFSKSTAVAS